MNSHNNDESTERPERTNDTRARAETSSASNWRNEHGSPDYDYLKDLAEQNSDEALAELKTIANDRNVGYDNNDTAQDLVDKIFSSMQKDEGDESI